MGRCKLPLAVALLLALLAQNVAGAFTVTDPFVRDFRSNASIAAAAPMALMVLAGVWQTA